MVTDYYTKKFNKHNQKLFEKKVSTKKIFLLEFNGWSAIHIIFSYLVLYFKYKKKCKIIAYECYDLLNRLNAPWYKNIFWKLGIFLNLKTFKIFKSFGTDKFLKPSFSKRNELEAIKLTKKFLKKKNLKDLENLKIKDIWIGDLIYDSYLKKYQKPTIDLNSSDFFYFLKNAIELHLYWLDFFNKNKVEAICVCHAVYLTGIPLRIANHNNIKSFAISGLNCDPVNLSNRIRYSDKISASDIHSRFYKKIFYKYSNSTKKKFLFLGKKILTDIVSGKQKYNYLKYNFYQKNKIKLGKKSKKVRVAVFAHDFIDSPHIYGNHFFPDFKQWFNFLNILIKNTDYDWYIKEHPQIEKITKNEINKLLKKNKKLKLLKKNFPIYNMKKMGFDFVLTVYGTVASELAVQGIKVINASRNNPHNRFNFSINPKNLTEYRNLLFNLNKISFNPNIKDLYMFHFMKNLVLNNNLFFNNEDKYFKILKEKPLRFTPLVYKHWLDDFNLKKHYEILKNLEIFLNKEDYFFYNEKILLEDLNKLKLR